jgi:hypothetical protein
VEIGFGVGIILVVWPFSVLEAVGVGVLVRLDPGMSVEVRMLAEAVSVCVVMGFDVGVSPVCGVCSVLEPVGVGMVVKLGMGVEVRGLAGGVFTGVAMRFDAGTRLVVELGLGADIVVVANGIILVHSHIASVVDRSSLQDIAASTSHVFEASSHAPTQPRPKLLQYPAQVL